VVVVEVEGTWLVLGVAPGRVAALHAMPKGSAVEFEPAAGAPPPPFAALLARFRS
jgi:flagellar protein FliO/FliZ